MRKPPTVVAWSMLASYAAGVALTVVLAVANGSVAGGRVILLYLPAFTAFMVVGALVVAAAQPTPSAGCSRPLACWQAEALWPLSTATTPM
jgi:hypothetical protein